MFRFVFGSLGSLFKFQAAFFAVAHVQGVRLNHTIFTREERSARVSDCIAL
jgi:hypothetical protein